MSRFRRDSAAMQAAGACLLWLGTAIAHADEVCSAYMMDVASEVELFRAAPTPITAGSDAEVAPQITPGTLYQVNLAAQKGVTFAASASSRPRDPGLSGGVLKLGISEAGKYRVSIDASFWIDVVVEGTALTALDFRGDRECAGPRKIVTFQLPAGATLIVQLADASTQQVRLALTPASEEPW